MIKIETVGQVTEDGKLTIAIDKKLIGIGKHSLVLFIDEEADASDLDKYPLSEEDRMELINRMKSYDNNPETSMDWDDVKEELEVEFGKKVPVYK